jgi:putative hydrolase of the HAD superfamily
VTGPGGRLDDIHDLGAVHDFTEVKAVLFDIDDTLVDTRQAFRAGVNAALDVWMPHLDAEDRERAVLRWATDPLGAWGRFTRGETDMRGQRMIRLTDLNANFGGPPVDDDLLDAWLVSYDRAFRAEWRPFEDGVRLVTSLARLGVTIGAVTNMFAAAQREKLAAVGLAELIPIVGSLETVGVGKPDPRIWQVACRTLGVAPSEALYVGDEPEIDAVGSSLAGLHGVWLDRHSGSDVDPRQGSDLPVRVRSLDELPGLLGWELGEKTLPLRADLGTGDAGR